MLINMKQEGDRPDVITFAGNGEPTIHPGFSGIIDDTVSLRNEFFRDARIAVLSNASMIHKNEVFMALKKVDQNILKLDSGIEATIRFLNQPPPEFRLKEAVEKLMLFRGDFILQTLFINGTYKNKVIDNTTESELNAWLPLVRKLRPREVMIYTIARDTPVRGLKKVSPEKLREIAKKVEGFGIPVSISS